MGSTPGSGTRTPCTAGYSKRGPRTRSFSAFGFDHPGHLSHGGGRSWWGRATRAAYSSRPDFTRAHGTNALRAGARNLPLLASIRSRHADAAVLLPRWSSARAATRDRGGVHAALRERGTRHWERVCAAAGVHFLRSERDGRRSSLAESPGRPRTVVKHEAMARGHSSPMPSHARGSRSRRCTTSIRSK